MKMEIAEILKRNVGAHMSIVFESESTKRMYEYSRYNFIFENEKQELYIKEGMEEEVKQDTCIIDLSAVLSVEERNFYDMERIVIRTLKERISILIFKFGFTE